MANGHNQKGLDAVRAPQTYKEWRVEIESLTPARCEELAGALETLEQWPAFNNAFGWTRLFALKVILKLTLSKEK